jgi:hypothetical protein
MYDMLYNLLAIYAHCLLFFGIGGGLAGLMGMLSGGD